MPKQIILKTTFLGVHQKILQELSAYSKMKYTHHQINGEYTVAIFCDSYYSRLFKTPEDSSIYHSYIYLYTTISLILCKVIIECFEPFLLKHYLKKNHLSAFQKQKQKKKIKAIISMLLDDNFPSENAKKIYQYRSDLIFHELLLLFRKQNHVTLDSVALFSLPYYHHFLEDVVDITTEMVTSKKSHEDFINFILNNFFK